MADTPADHFWLSQTVTKSLYDLTDGGMIEPAALTVSTNDYNPPGLHGPPLPGAGVVLISATEVLNLTGILAPPKGMPRAILILNSGSFAIELRNEAATSAAANRFALSTVSHELLPSQGLRLYYNPSAARWALQERAVPSIGDSPLGYARRGRLTFVDTSIVTIGTTGVTSVFRDSTGAENLRWTGTLTADLTGTLAGGLDVGTEDADAWYALHVIGGGDATPAALLSLSATAPTLPGGFSLFRFLGWIRNDSGSDILEFVQWGSGQVRWIHYRVDQSSVLALSAGGATAFTAVDLSPLVPSTVTRSYLQVRHDGNQSSDYVALRATGSGLADPPGRVYDSSASVWQETDTSQSIDYENSTQNEETTIWVIGYMVEL